MAWRAIDDRAVIIDSNAAQVHDLDEVGSFLWFAADGQANLAEIASSLTEEFEVDFEEALTDAREFFETLEKKGLVSLSREIPESAP